MKHEYVGDKCELKAGEEWYPAIVRKEHALYIELEYWIQDNVQIKKLRRTASMGTKLRQCSSARPSIDHKSLQGFMPSGTSSPKLSPPSPPSAYSTNTRRDDDMVELSRLNSAESKENETVEVIDEADESDKWPTLDILYDIGGPTIAKSMSDLAMAAEDRDEVGFEGEVGHIERDTTDGTEETFCFV